MAEELQLADLRRMAQEQMPEGKIDSLRQEEALMLG